MVKHLGKREVFSLAILAMMSGFGAVPALAADCLDCHAEIVVRGAQGVMQLRGASHHVQGVGISGRHCYACHWEAMVDGRIDARYHLGTTAKGTKEASRAPIDLVIWAAGQRPAVYKRYSTAMPYAASAIGTPQERQELAKISRHCLGCHHDQNNDTRPFPGDDHTPRQYAWDKQSVAARYLELGTAPWGKYATDNTNRKSQVIKAFSAHGNAVANQGGWSPASGYDGDLPLTRGGSSAKNVECFDCHNAHGSTVSGVTSSYRTFDGSFNGGILKTTHAGKQGYAMTYAPSANTNRQSNNPYSAGAGLCFDCHETARAGATPWGYSTFGAVQPIIGYKDTMHFGSGTKGSSARFMNRQGRSEIVSSHLKAGRFLNYSTQDAINGLCTPCHDPHGVSRTLGAKMPYAVPLLKGTWLTSPYREDTPPTGAPANAGAQREPGAALGAGDYNTVNREANANFGKGGSGAPVAGAWKEGDYNTVNREANANFGKGGSGAPVAGAWKEGDYNTVNRDANANFGKGGSGAPVTGGQDFNQSNRDANSNFGKSGSGSPREPMAGMKYNVDRNTFGGTNRIIENDDIFGGLCLRCHNRIKGAGDTRADRIHRAVKGWGSNTEHSFPCAKCHQSHNSGLPRLMQTNCFEAGPAGLRENSGLPWLPATKGATGAWGVGAQGTPASTSKKTGTQVVGCHVRQFGGSSAKQDNSQWQEKSSW